MELKEILPARALLLQQVRAFFMDRNVLEVETPLLSAGIGTDPNLSPVRAVVQTPETQNMFLQTSPEFAMKRLLSMGSGSIFQICKAFRNGETSSKHNPEFTMLEWYRVKFDEHQLMDEVEELTSAILGIENIQRLSYRELFLLHLNIDPHQASLASLEEKAKAYLDISFSADDPDIWLDLLYSHLIEPELKAPTFIYNYPKSQAALAQIHTDENGVEVARRFELVMQGLELANGYCELRDVDEHQKRFKADQSKRVQRGLPQHPEDDYFVAALKEGLPACAGVAVGLDRLLMLKLEAKSIREVIPFTIDKV